MKLLAVSLLVCAMMALTGADEGGRPTASCPTGWMTYNRTCYIFFSTPSTWADAERDCMSHGAHLASVHSHGEENAIQNMIKLLTHSNPVTWLGGHDATQEGTWFWSDGTPFDYTNWAVGEPNNLFFAHCLVMNFGVNKEFDDRPCYFLRPYVCAKKQ